MRRFLLFGLTTAAVVVAAWIPLPAEPAAPQAQPRTQAEPRRGAEPRAPSAEPQRSRPAEPQKAQPRPPAGRDEPPAEPRQGEGRRRQPPPRVVPPQYHGVPRAYFFPPVSRQRGFYYHPYFGFYFGPYYGPYYPYPGPFAGAVRYSASAVRTRVKPAETEVYVNGYYAGLVDDFDGMFQRLYLPAGGQDLEFHLDGYRSHRVRLFLQPGDTREIVHQMQRAPAGDRTVPPVPEPLDGEWTTETLPSGDRPASPYGILAVRVEPSDATVLIDGEVWFSTERQTALVVHIPSGWHELEVRKEGYRSFRSRIELSEGATFRMNIVLER